MQIIVSGKQAVIFTLGKGETGGVLVPPAGKKIVVYG
jgi:hypothetical protein